MNKLEKTVTRDTRRNPKLDGPRWLHAHQNTADLHADTMYDYTIGEMLWAAHKHTVLHPEDTTPDPTNMLDRVAYARKVSPATAPATADAIVKLSTMSEVEWDTIFGMRR